MDGVDEITKQSRILYQYAHANILADVDCPEDDDALSVFQYLTEALTRQVMALQRMTPLNETDLNASDSRNSVLSPSPDGDAVAFFDGWLEHVLRRGVATAIARIIKVEDTTPNTKRFPAEVIFAALEFLRICFSGCRGVQTVRVLETCGLCQALLSRVEDVVHAPSSDVKGSTSSLDIDGPSCASAPDDDGEVPSLFDLRQQRLLQITALHLLCGVATRLQTWMIERLLLAYSPHLLNHLAAMLSDASPPSCVEGMEGAPERVEVAQKAMSLLLVLHRRHPRMVRVLRRHVGEMSQRPPPKHYRADLVFALVDVLQWRFGNVDVASGVGEGSASSSRTGWRREHGRLVCDAAQLLLLVLRTSTQIPGISLEHAMVHPELPPCCNPGGDRSWISLRVKREHAPRIRMDDVEPQLLWRWGGPSMLRRYVHVGDGATPSHQRPVASGPQVAAPQLDNKSPCLTSAPIPGGHSSLSGYEEEQVELNELLDAVAAADGLDVLCRIISTNCGESRGELSSSRRLRRAALDVLWIMAAEGSLAHLRWLATCSNLFVGLRATLNNHVRHDHHHALGVSHLSSAASTPPYMATSPHPGWIQATLDHGSATRSHTSAVAEHFLLPPQHHTTSSNTRDLDVNPSSMSTSMWRAEDAGTALHLVRVLYARLRADNAWFRRGEEDSPYRKQGCDVECAESIVGWLAMLHVDEPIEEEDGLLLKCIAVDAVQALASICMCCGVESISSTGTAHGGLWRQPYGQDVPRWSLPRVLCQALLQPRTQDDGVLLQLIRAELRASQGWGANTPPTAIAHAIVVLQLYQWCLTSLPSASERSERVVGSWSCEELRRRQLDFLVEDAAGVLPLLVELSAGRAGCITSGAADLQHKALEALRAVLAHVQHGPSSSWLVAGAPPPKCVDVVDGRRTSFIYAVPEPDAWTAPSDTVPLSTSPNTSIENSGLVSHVVADADLASPTCVSDAPSEGADALEMFSLQLDAAVDVVRLSTWLFSLGLEEVLFHVLADVLPFQHRCLCDAMRAAQHNPPGPSLEDLDDRHDPHHQMGHEGADEPHPLPATPPDFRNLWDCMKIVGAWVAMLGQAHTSSLAQEHLRRLWVGGIGFTLCYLVLRCGPCCSASMLWQSEPPYASGGALISEDSEGSISLLSSDDGGFSASLTSMRRRSVHVPADADPLDNLLMSVDGPEEEEEQQVVVLHPVGANLNEPTQRMLRHMDALFSLSVELVLLAMSAEKLKDAGDAVIAELANTWLGRANLSEVEDSSTVKRVAQHEGAEAAAALLGSVESLEKRIRLCA